jgi:hypothetical protein
VPHLSLSPRSENIIRWIGIAYLLPVIWPLQVGNTFFYGFYAAVNLCLVLWLNLMLGKRALLEFGFLIVFVAAIFLYHLGGAPDRFHLELLARRLPFLLTIWALSRSDSLRLLIGLRDIIAPLLFLALTLSTLYAVLASFNFNTNVRILDRDSGRIYSNMYHAMEFGVILSGQFIVAPISLLLTGGREQIILLILALWFIKIPRYHYILAATFAFVLFITYSDIFHDLLSRVSREISLRSMDGNDCKVPFLGRRFCDGVEAMERAPPIILLVGAWFVLPLIDSNILTKYASYDLHSGLVFGIINLGLPLFLFYLFRFTRTLCLTLPTREKWFSILVVSVAMVGSPSILFSQEGVFLVLLLIFSARR